MSWRSKWLVAAVLVAGCGDGLGVTNSGEEPQAIAKQGEAWDSANNPSIFASDLEYRLAALPASGEAQTVPWAGSYWPVAEDSINHKWAGAGSESAPKKYQNAFGGTGLEDAVSAQHGIDAFTSRKVCSTQADCTGETNADGICSKREGAATGRCIPGWWGICHAWAPASIMLPEPRHAVTRNGVTFEVQDLKALATLVHNSTSSRFVSLRCNDTGTSALDAYGRVVANSCRDTNPGTFHLLVTNYLGLRHQAFVEDRVAGAEVWNQPLRSFQVIDQHPVTIAEANALLSVPAQGATTTQQTGTVAAGAWSHLGAFAVEAGSLATVTMTGTGDADLYVRFGAQPDTSTYTCRPYSGTSDETCQLTVPVGETQLFVSVNGYAATSDFSVTISTGGRVPTTYAFNAAAASLVSVTMDLRYISESSASTGYTGSTIASYTMSDRYQYLLELDAAGKIIGGEWVGASRTSHPDFLWLPTGVATSSVAQGKISYATVKSLVLESVTEQAPVDGGAGDAQSAQVSGAVAAQQWRVYGPFTVTAGANLTAVMTGTGDADLYVKLGMRPTATSYDCRPYGGNSNETCTVAGGGPVYVAVNGYAASSTYALALTWTGAPADAAALAGTDTGVDAGTPPEVDAGLPEPIDAGTEPADAGTPGVALVRIDEVLANEPGSAVGSEFVELVNTGTAAADLSGWTLSDASAVRHLFPAGTQLGAGDRLVVFAATAGAVAPGAQVQVASSRSLSLNNGGDQVVLRDASGTGVFAVTYGAALAAVDGVSLTWTPTGYVLHTQVSMAPSSPGAAP